MRHFRRGDFAAARELHDIKTAVDARCEAEILAAIRGSFPEHAVLSEESGHIAGTGECIWIVDPLDGTVNFWHGIPFFGVSIGCFRRNMDGNPGEALAGVVWLPCTAELFLAVRGAGALLNGSPIRAAALRRTGEALVSLSFGKTAAAMRRMTARLEILLPRVRKVRTLGAAAAEMAYVAAGFLGGTLYEGLKPWDFAAARVLLQEAGGTLEAEETETGSWRVLAAAPGVQRALRLAMSGDR
jgi:fructose-1,6-bisphosphatase/inositol monophosphatase family enzyme